MSGLVWVILGCAGFAFGVILIAWGSCRCAAEADERAEQVEIARYRELPEWWEYHPAGHVSWCTCRGCESVAEIIAGVYQ